LDEGKLLFEESMIDLTGRFREVHVITEREAHPPDHVPPHWMNVRATGNVLSFVDTQFSGEDLDERFVSLVGDMRRIDAQPMPLRSIFTTLARAARDGGKS
jgi:ABC-2 type transport system ATP-binding protein